MSRFKTILFGILTALAGGVGAIGEGRGAGDWRIYEPTVKEIHVAVLATAGGVEHVSYKTDYCLYFGDGQTQIADNTPTPVDTHLSLIHPAPEVAARYETAPGSPWYALFTDGSGQGVTLVPLLDREVWEALPAPLQHLVFALGVNDPDLILIEWNLRSGSMSIYYSPRYDTDRPFHVQKLNALKANLKGRDMEAAIPLDVVAGAAGSPAPTTVPADSGPSATAPRTSTPIPARLAVAEQATWRSRFFFNTFKHEQAALR